MMSDNGRRGSGRTQRMLQEAARSTARNNVIVAHTHGYAKRLEERFTSMMALQELKGRTFLFVGASKPQEVAKIVRGTGAKIFYDHYFYDHYFWDRLYEQKVAP